MKTIKIEGLVMAALTVVLATKTTNAADVNTDTNRHSCCSAGESVGAVTDKSLYQLDSSWTNDLGQPVRLSALRGRPQMVTMFFANCQYACPLLVYKMKQVSAALPESIRTNIGFTLITFDTERDTPSALHTYREQHELGNNWTLLQGTADDVLDLAALLGVKFKKDAQGQFLHSNVITVLNREGEIAFQEVGLNLKTEEIVHQIEKSWALLNHSHD